MPTRNDVETEQQLYGLPLLLHTLVIRLAATLLGQFLLHLSDRVLWTVENLTYWSIPPQRLAEFANAPQTPLVRPLSWWLFLPGLLCLRFIRKSCSVALWFVGIEPVTPVSMVCYVQVQRKKIQSIKQAGAKVIRKRREESAKRPGLIRAIWYKLQQICCLEYIFTENGEVKVLEPKNPEASESEESSEEETELTFAELLEKYASMECEENDPDYMPEEEESSESSEESGGDEGDMMFGEDDDTRKVLNRSFVCEPRQTYTRGDTPPLKGFSNSLHPGNIPHQDTTEPDLVDALNGITWIIYNDLEDLVRIITESNNNMMKSQAGTATTSAFPGTGSSPKATSPKEVKAKESDRNREIF
ncbi:uncharacterized protein LOC132259410 isoform X3 [Phlebotomus argentipes]|uniref:uncharacterized protein LOC132259410 isoform X3 n=1 Tax=Phlebotomus argentipes TaxID=94469 RepID=UPI0028932D5F|nr:uncharacterized protein LOC132259410 isoform X3 [Phlebotomus argentipes]